MVRAATEVGTWSRGAESEDMRYPVPLNPDGRGAVVLAFVNESGDANIAAGCVCVYVFQNTPLTCTSERGHWPVGARGRGQSRRARDILRDKVRTYIWARTRVCRRDPVRGRSASPPPGGAGSRAVGNPTTPTPACSKCWSLNCLLRPPPPCPYTMRYIGFASSVQRRGSPGYSQGGRGWSGRS